MKQEIFKGVGTAIVTPFRDEKIDYDCFVGLVNWQIESGVAALVVGGTTGEAATLTDSERYELYRVARDVCRGRCKLVLGTGTNDTRAAIKHTKEAERIGCEGVLVVTPYYNKGTREGLYRHYKAIAETSDLPIILYNVPSRTGVDLSPELVLELCKLPTVAAIKEASGGATRLAELSALDIALYAGNDSDIHTVLSLGGAGVISVVSNLYPHLAATLCRAYFSGNTAHALEIQQRLLPLISALFIETNPAPIKYAMSRRGLCSADMRLPMWLPTESARRKIDAALAKVEGAC